jgi:hypothetical protein
MSTVQDGTVSTVQDGTVSTVQDAPNRSLQLLRVKKKRNHRHGVPTVRSATADAVDKPNVDKCLSCFLALPFPVHACTHTHGPRTRPSSSVVLGVRPANDRACRERACQPACLRASLPASMAACACACACMRCVWCVCASACVADPARPSTKSEHSRTC